MSTVTVTVDNRIEDLCRKIPSLPRDMHNPGYRRRSSHGPLQFMQQYIAPAEWAQLAHGVNASIERHHFCNKPCVMACFAMSFGVCFCPMVSVAMEARSKVNADMLTLPIVQQLAARGIDMTWCPNSDFASGGMTFQISPQTPLVQAAQAAAPRQFSITVPAGMKAGQVLQIANPAAGGGPMQVTIPAGVSAGMSFLIEASAPTDAPAPTTNIPVVQGVPVTAQPQQQAQQQAQQQLQQQEPPPQEGGSWCRRNGWKFCLLIPHAWPFLCCWFAYKKRKKKNKDARSKVLALQDVPTGAIAGTVQQTHALGGSVTQ